MNIKPIADSVFVKEDSETKTEGGIILTEAVKHFEGLVVAAGPKAVEVKIGDRVLFRQFGGEKQKVGDTEYRVLREGEILAVIENV